MKVPTLRETLTKKRDRAAFIPYLTAGDPSLAATEEVLDALAAAGANVIELGIPFSDPSADGPVNQRAAERALKSGTTLTKVLDLVAKRRAKGDGMPYLIFTYYNPVFRMGLEKFASAAKKAGVQGALIVDLPPEEAQDYRRAMQKADLETVFLAAPTTTDARLKTIGEASSGFVYYVSRLGVTGESVALADGLGKEIARVRKLTQCPVAVGFGISTPKQAKDASFVADGVIVGSALVRAAEEAGAAKVKELAAAMTAAMGDTSC